MPNENPSKFYLTTPIYYVNARPHIGHAYTTIVADVLARQHRLQGDDTFFLTGTDEHGQKIERSAAAAGIPPQQFTDQVSANFRALWERMGLTYDRYIRTTDDAHKLGVQKLFTELYYREKIYLSTYTGAYCVSDEAFVDLPVGTPCPDCGKILEEVTEENFFFKLSEYQLPLLNLIESNDLVIEPATARNEVLSFLRGGTPKMVDGKLLVPGENDIERTAAGFPYVPGALKDLSISRSSFTWGIPVPDAVQKASGTTQQHVVYVWLDALANYMTAVGYGSDKPEDIASFARYWPADLHLVGKEITRFHCIYWPAFLLAAGLPLPKKITANGWLLFDNAKMSKSRGNVVRSETILDAFGERVYATQFPDSTKRERDLFASDVLRYFLLREIPFGQDGSFSFDAMVTRYNADLANGYGNLVSRTLSMIDKYFAGEVPAPVFEDTEDSNIAPDGFDAAVLSRAGEALKVRLKELSETDFATRLSEIAAFITTVDGFITANAPWKLAKDEAMRGRLATVLYVTAEAVRWATGHLYTICPFVTERVWAQLGLGSMEHSWRNGELANLYWGGLAPGTKLGPLGPLFPRAEKTLAETMIEMENENARPAAPLAAAATPATPERTPTSTTDPAAPPRSLDEPSGTLSVAGSAAVTTERVHTPHTDANPSGPFASAASQSPVTAGPADASPQITIDDFVKVELRVAEILVAERIPKADKLLRLEVSLGDILPQRQILSGIAEWYTPEDLIGKRILIITNLAPRKMRGLESHGMLLAASEEGGKPFLATVPEGVPVGTRLK
ncbi:MAG: methionine--tRNA ligase subunit beta [Acidobacteriaceae bacterium]|nr:methionine--tRNA ligase subunit beta [Acidobacteriaceae bacterium]